MSRQLSQSKIINQFEDKHGKYYDYSLVEYKAYNIPITIICPIHGKFEQWPTNHKKHGCKQCGLISTHKNNITKQDKVINQFKDKHGKLYDYSLVKYIDGKTKVDIICAIHGIFPARPDHHKNGVGCKKCNHNPIHNRTYYKGKKTTLYYIKVDNLYKIGVTIHSVKTRYSNDKLTTIQVIKEWIFEDGADAFDYEQTILNTNKRLRYNGPKILTSGNSELFNQNILEDINLLIPNG